MTDKEIKLINMIRNHNDPNKATVIALTTICWYLMQSQSFAKPFAAGFQEPA